MHSEEKQSKERREKREEKEKRKKKTEENKGNPHPSETPISNLNFLVKERQKKKATRLLVGTSKSYYTQFVLPKQTWQDFSFFSGAKSMKSKGRTKPKQNFIQNSYI